MLIILSLGSTLHYGNKYINKRDFMDLRNASMSKTINSEKLSDKLSGLKWISCLMPNNPKKEIEQLLEVMKIIKNDNANKSIITDYQFISVALSIYDFSQSHVWFINHVVNQKNDSKYYKIYKDFFIKNIKRNKIKKAYLVKPLWGGNEVFENGLNSDCYKKEKITEILDVYTLKECKELK